MWTETSLERIKELGITKEQVDKISSEIYLGVNIVTKVLWISKQMELIKITVDKNNKL